MSYYNMCKHALCFGILSAISLDAHSALSYPYARAGEKIVVPSPHIQIPKSLHSPVVPRSNVHLEHSQVQKGPDKPIVAEGAFVCAVATFYNIPCKDDWVSIYEPYGENHPYALGGIYLIEPNTHRTWLTSSAHPKEVPMDRLRYYEKSLTFFRDQSFTHHFWCNGKHLIPKTIAAIERFSTPVIIHDISEISDGFVNKKLFEKFMQDRMWSFANDLVKSEVLLQRGGLYSDIGLEQKQDLSSYFRQYEGFVFADRAYAAKMGSPFLNATLNLMKQMPGILKNLSVRHDSITLLRFMAYHAWKIVLAQGNIPKSQFVKANFDQNFNHHGLDSWFAYLNKLTPDYISVDE